MISIEEDTDAQTRVIDEESSSIERVPPNQCTAPWAVQDVEDVLRPDPFMDGVPVYVTLCKDTPVDVYVYNCDYFRFSLS